jgi:hypothetical protein
VGFDRPIPVALVAGGEGEEAWELQGTKHYLLVGSGRGGGGRRWVVDGEQRRSEHGIGGEGAPVGTGRGGEVCKLREDEAERVWIGGSTVNSSSSELGWAAAVFWMFGAGSWRKSEWIGLRSVHWC